MCNSSTLHDVRTNLHEHHAVQAWQRIAGERSTPSRIETLKLKKKSAVFRLHGAGPGRTTLIAKRCVAATGMIERRVYEEILARLPSPTLRCLGFLQDSDANFVWLFLDDAEGHEYSPTCDEHRRIAGRWLAHVEYAARAAGAQTWLPEHGSSHYLRQLNSARSSLLENVLNPGLTEAEAATMHTLALEFDQLETHWDELECCLEPEFRTLVHGDFVAKNLRMRAGSSVPALVAFDWEMAGWGVPATDLAQGIGHCASPDLEAYRAVMRQDGQRLGSRDIRHIADLGRLLRIVDKIYWTTSLLVSESRSYLIKPLGMFASYQHQLSSALRTVGWN